MLSKNGWNGGQMVGKGNELTTTEWYVIFTHANTTHT